MTNQRTRLMNFMRSIFPMPLDKAVAITEYFNEKTFDKNDFVLKQGRHCNDYYFLCEGFMRAWTIDLEGKDVTTSFYPAGNIVCELVSFFRHIPSQENIQALTDCTTLCISFDDLQNAFHSMPEFREFGRGLLISFYINLKQRMLSGLHETAETRYRNLITSTPEVFQYASLKNIASYLGVTDTSLSRIRKEFAKENQHS